MIYYVDFDNLTGELKGFYPENDLRYNTSMIKISSELWLNLLSLPGTYGIDISKIDYNRIYTKFDEIFVADMFLPEQPIPQESPYDVLQRENQELRAQLAMTQEAIDYIIMNGGV